MEPGLGSGSVPAVRKDKQAQPQTSTTHRSAGPYSRSERLGSPLACHNDPTTLAYVAPCPRQLLLNYHKAQMKKVLNHARAELMKGVRKVRYSYLIVEGEFSRLLFFLEPIFDILVQVRSHRLPSKRTLLHQSRLPSSSCRCPADSVEGMRVPCSPPYLSMLNERPLVLSNNLSPFVCASVHNFVTHVCLMVLCSWICLALCHVVK